MLKSRKAVGLSITTIIVAIIGLIVLVVLIAIFTGRTSIYSSTVDELTTCKNTCKNIGYTNGLASSERSCGLAPGVVIPGSYSDISGKNSVGQLLRCCCV